MRRRKKIDEEMGSRGDTERKQAEIA